MGQAICIRKDEKPLGYDWECGHEELYVRVNMYYNGSLYIGLWQEQKECEEKLELFGDLTIGVMGFLRPGQAIISDCGAKAKVAFIEKYKLGKVIGKRKINYGSYYVVEFNLARLAQLDPEGTERYLLENGLDTLEVEPDGTIRQTRTFYNQQNEDIELARDFLVKWQKQLKKKLAKEDYKLAVKSQSLRKKEIEELRSKGVRVNGVGYCNKLLAEILEEDLMEAGNRELEEQAA